MVKSGHSPLKTMPLSVQGDRRGGTSKMVGVMRKGGVVPVKRGIWRDMAERRQKSKQLRRLEKIFRDIREDKKETVRNLIENAAFMEIQLAGLQKEIAEKGPVSEYKNGENQWGTKKSPEVEIYNTMIKNYMAVVRQLLELLPEGGADEKDELMSFIGGGG